jgi:AraC-like DNA-binding protein
MNELTKKIVELYKKDISVKEISYRVNLSESSILTRLALQGLYMSPIKAKTLAKREELSKNELAKKLNEILGVSLLDWNYVSKRTLQALYNKLEG